MKKSIIAIVALIMILSALPTAAFAAESDLDNVKSTLDFIEQNKSNGALTDQKLLELANQIANLERAIASSGQRPSSEVVATILRAEGIVGSMSSANAKKAQTAIAMVKASLGITGSGSSTGGVTSTEVTITLDNANAGTVTFPDIKGHWAQTTIEKLASEGVITGIQQSDGSYKFAPNDSVTVSQFLTLVVRSVVPEGEIKAKPANGHWAQGFYDTAKAKGIIDAKEIKNEDIDKVISREDMAYILVGVGKYKGETWTIKNGTQAGIPDFNTVSGNRQTVVAQAYSEGYLKGDDTGAFKPQNGLTRAESATVINNINMGGAQTTPQTTGGTLSKAGDTYTREDGTTIILEIDSKSGILGAHQGPVKADLGKTIPGANKPVYVGYTDADLGRYELSKNGESGFFTSEWTQIMKTTRPTTVGSQGEVRGYWQYDKNVLADGENPLDAWVWIGGAIQ